MMSKPSDADLVAFRTAAALNAVPDITHGFFGRQGGVSRGIYTSLNCGLGSSDDRASVLENRRRVAACLAAEPQNLLTCHQVHSANAIIVDRPWGADSQPKADAIVTRTPGLAVGALAADCVPVLFADRSARVIAAAHAGWKGALGGIIEATLTAIESLGGHRETTVAAIGPCIGPMAYEVGPEFKAVFVSAQSGYAAFFEPRGPAGRPHFDLPAFVGHRLRAAGVGVVDMAWQCTYSNPGESFSYRLTTHRAESDYGRQISAIALSRP
jgi:polyphenol oxidase